MLKSKRITLRAVELKDIDCLYSWENDQNNWIISNLITPYSKEIIKNYIHNSSSDLYTAKQLRLMIDLTAGECIGTIDLFEFDPKNLRAGIGVLIATKKHRLKGYAYEALNLLITYCFNHLHLHQLYCNIITDNKASLELFKKCNFKITGEKKEWIRVNNRYKNEYMLQLINKK